MPSKNPNILVVLTNVHQFPNREEQYQQLQASSLGSDVSANRAGFDIKEVAYLYECLQKRQNCNLLFATPRGGEAPIDPRSMEAARNDEIVKRFLQDKEIMQEIKNTKRLRDVQQANIQGQLMGAIFPGGAGVPFDLPHEPMVNELVQHIYEKQEGFIAAIGHGIAALLNVQNEEGELWLKGKRVTCQTLEEEKELKLERALPFMIEEKLKQIGAKVEKASKFQPNVVEDERLITAQNNYSTKEWVEAISRHCQMLN